MSQKFRLADGGRIRREQKLNFRFNGQSYTGFAGDTLSSALLANGVHLIGRSFKYHRPRGIFSAGVEEPNAIFQLEKGAITIPNARGTQQELYADLDAHSVNCWPSLRFDWMSINRWFSRLMPAGFYYKTFMWPKSMWMQYEHWIRKASGLGKSPRLRDPDCYEHLHAHCDLLVVGGGVCGLAAALAAGRAGARVILIDEQAEPGGLMLSSTAQIDDQSAAVWIDSSVAELVAMAEVRVLSRSTAFGYHNDHFITVNQRLTDHLTPNQRRGPRERIWQVRARRVILATGAIERPLVFANNDRPGVMLASAVSTYIHRYALKPGQRVVIFSNNDSACQTALDCKAVGIEVVAVVDVRAQSVACDRLRNAGIDVLYSSVVVDTSGDKRLRAVRVMRISDDLRSVTAPVITLDCDLLAIAGGWNPAVHLSAQSGAPAVWDDAQAMLLPGQPTQEQVSVGAAAGDFDLKSGLQQATAAGNAAASACGFTAKMHSPLASAVARDAILPLWQVPDEGRDADAFIDLQNDVTVADIKLAVAEGLHSVEHVKRYTAMGFGTDQGKLGNINGMAILAQTLGQRIGDTGTTTYRPNYTPVSLGAIAGLNQGSKLFDPVRKTAMHDWHQAQGAEFENVGQWKRPWYYPQAHESRDDAVNRECLAVRQSVGIFDASTLGKIEIIGRDAGRFLDMIYTNHWSNLAVGRARYGIMLGEDGMVMDDGVTIRIAKDHFYMHTTTGGAAEVLMWMERWLQTEWPEMEVYLTSVTDHWATVAVVGPDSRKVVSAVFQDIDFSKNAFPFMASRTGAVDGIGCRINRISFSGELAYEVNIPAHCGQFLWEQLLRAGAAFNITAYGTETMHVLRAEKGYIIVGQDTDGSLNPTDLGLGWTLSKTKADYIGKRSLSRPDSLREDRKQLVGLITEDPSRVIPEGAQLVAEPAASIPVSMLGHVTSSYYSACCGHSIALALVQGGRRRIGESVSASMPDGQWIKATITEPIFYDQSGVKANA